MGNKNSSKKFEKEKKINLIILGTGEAGKSTFTNQVNYLNINNLSFNSENEAKDYMEKFNSRILMYIYYCIHNTIDKTIEYCKNNMIKLPEVRPKI
jgi:hypothetical protein